MARWVGLTPWFVVAGDSSSSQGEPEQNLEEWRLLSEQEMLADLVETARLEDGWAAGCLWRDDGDMGELIFPPNAARIEDGVLPSGRRFSVLRGGGAACGSVRTWEDDAYLCVEPVGAGDELQGGV